MSKTKIEWTDATWNPVTGCTKISHGCANCYAERMALRMKAMGVTKYSHGFHVAVHDDVLSEPLRWRSPRMVFVNSMSDLFHKDVSDDFIKRVFDIMNQATRHRFQILTKRPERVALLSSSVHWSHNIWMGTSIESQEYIGRAKSLLDTGSHIKFLSCEPLLGHLRSLNLVGIDWVIVGGESGPGARPMKVEWVRDLRDRCVKHGVPFFFKQWGGVWKKKNGRMLDGVMWSEFPGG